MPTVEELQAQVDDLARKYKDEIEANKKFRERAQKAEAEAEAARKANEKAEADKAAAESKAEQARLESKGEYDKALKLREEQTAKELAARDKAIADRDAILSRQFGQSALLAALGKAGVKSELIGQAARLVESQVKVEFKDGQAVVQVFDDKGQALDCIDTLAAAFAKGNPHFLPPAGGGSGGAAGGGGGGVTLAQLDRDAVAKGKFIKENPEAYQKMVAADLAAKREARENPKKG
jgi:hypothetical protein